MGLAGTGSTRRQTRITGREGPAVAVGKGGPIPGRPDAAAAHSSPAADDLLTSRTDRVNDPDALDSVFNALVRTDSHGIVQEADVDASRLLMCPREFVIGKPLGL